MRKLKIFCVVLLTFTIMLIVSFINQRRFLKESKDKSHLSQTKTLKTMQTKKIILRLLLLQILKV